MGYGDHWQRAQDAARDAIGSLGAGDQATLVLFGRNAEENMRATSDRGRLEAALDAAKVTSGATRYGPALKLAESILARSTLPAARSDPDLRLPEVGLDRRRGRALRRGHDAHAGVGRDRTDVRTSSVPSVTFARAPFSGQERITRHGRRRQQERRRRRPTCRSRSRSTATQIETQTGERRRQRVRVGRVRAVHARRTAGRAASSRPAPIRSPADNTFRLRAHAEPAGLGARRSTAASATDPSFYLSKALGDRQRRRRFRSKPCRPRA